MKGLELARQFYEEYGKPMIEEEFGEWRDRIAVGLVGHGSECFGYDDDISRDHDYEAGFNIWITEKDEHVFGFPLFRAYRKLPKEYKGYRLEKQSLQGSGFKGVKTIPEFYSFYTGSGGAPKEIEQWMAIPSFYLAEATNGEVFIDPLGEFTSIREQLLNGMPEDVRRKKLASSLLYMAQTGQYNYARCLSHGEEGAAILALNQFADQCVQAVFLLNKRHCPYYKWQFRAMGELSMCGFLSGKLTELISHPLDCTQNTEKIEEICVSLVDGMVAEGIVSKAGAYLEPYAYQITEQIVDGVLRNSPILL